MLGLPEYYSALNMGVLGFVKMLNFECISEDHSVMCIGEEILRFSQPFEDYVLPGCDTALGDRF